MFTSTLHWAFIDPLPTISSNVHGEQWCCGKEKRWVSPVEGDQSYEGDNMRNNQHPDFTARQINRGLCHRLLNAEHISDTTVAVSGMMTGMLLTMKKLEDAGGWNDWRRVSFRKRVP